MISGQALVRAQGVDVTFGGAVRALADVGFDIPPGQFLSIVGPSGCGKSTLLRLIAGLANPTSGQVLVAGEPPVVARRKSTRLSFVFQDATLLPWRSVRDNVRLPLELLGTPGADHEALVGQVLRMVGLEEFARNFADQLSGGMRMRVSLARALVIDPELLLLDEPFGALDDITRQTLNEELLGLWGQRHWTGVFVTHNIAEAVFLSERILVMSARPGHIVADIAVPFAAPRTRELRTRAEFARLVGEVGDCLRKGSV